MTDQEKILFVEALIDSVKQTIVDTVPKMPDTWDGHELRRYVADKFESCVMGDLKKDKRKWRYRAYENSVIIRNL